MWLNIELGEAGWTVASDALCRGCTVLWIMAHGPPWGMQLGLKIRYFQHLLLTRCIQCVWCFRQQSKEKQTNAMQCSAMQYRLGLGRWRGGEGWRAGPCSHRVSWPPRTATIAKVAAMVWSWCIQFSAARNVGTVLYRLSPRAGADLTHIPLRPVQVLYDFSRPYIAWRWPCLPLRSAFIYNALALAVQYRTVAPCSHAHCTDRSPSLTSNSLPVPPAAFGLALNLESRPLRGCHWLAFVRSKSKTPFSGMVRGRHRDARPGDELCLPERDQTTREETPTTRAFSPPLSFPISHPPPHSLLLNIITMLSNAPR